MVCKHPDVECVSLGLVDAILGMAGADAGEGRCGGDPEAFHGSIDVHLVFIDSSNAKPFSAQRCGIVPRKRWVDALSLPAKRTFNARGGARRSPFAPHQRRFGFCELPALLRTPALLKRQIRTRAHASGLAWNSVAAASFQTARLEAE